MSALRLAMVLVLVSAPIARAQPTDPATDPTTDRAKALYAEGSKSYDLREYQKAIDAFRAAYDLQPVPLLLFNTGQAYRQLNDCENARSFYQSYLRKLPDADNRVQVERFIAEMDSCIAKRDRERADAARLRRTEPRDIVADPTARTLKIVGLIAAGAGAVLVGSGIYFSLEAQDLASDVEASCEAGCDVSDIADLDRRGIAAERTATVLYAIGSVAAVTGIGLLVYASMRGTTSGVAVTPTTSGATVTKMWSF
jgi:tetratricopeptide (TPR) repeat protein